MYKAPNKMDKFNPADIDISGSDEDLNNEVQISDENHNSKIQSDEKLDNTKLPAVPSATSKLKLMRPSAVSMAKLEKMASEVVSNTIKSAAASLNEMIEFTIVLTQRDKVGTEVSDPDCRCVCHPETQDACSCKNESEHKIKHAPGLSHDKLQMLYDEMDPQQIIPQTGRECKCLMRRMELEKELQKASLEPVKMNDEIVRACQENCACHCHEDEDKNYESPDKDQCSGTCAVHCLSHDKETVIYPSVTADPIEENINEAKPEEVKAKKSILKRLSKVLPSATTLNAESSNEKPKIEGENNKEKEKGNEEDKEKQEVEKSEEEIPEKEQNPEEEKEDPKQKEKKPSIMKRLSNSIRRSKTEEKK